MSLPVLFLQHLDQADPLPVVTVDVHLRTPKHPLLDKVGLFKDDTLELLLIQPDLAHQHQYLQPLFPHYQVLHDLRPEEFQLYDFQLYYSFAGLILCIC